MYIVENPQVKPTCPHCEKPLARMRSHQVRSSFGKRYVYSCGVCHKVLGVSQRKGFWMG